MDKIGKIYALKVPCLNNVPGTIGICFNEYSDFNDEDEVGIQVIFENGEYDGFSAKEQIEMLTEIGVAEEHQNYEFEHVIKVSTDFRNGLWKETFEKNKLL